MNEVMPANNRMQKNLLEIGQLRTVKIGQLRTVKYHFLIVQTHDLK